RLQRKWNAVVYAFFCPEVEIIHSGNRRAHVFRCAGSGCSKTISRYLDTHDSTSTKNLRNHVKTCKAWGENILTEAEGLSVQEARSRIQNIPRAGSITAAFARQGKGTVRFSTRQHTKDETRKRPFSIVKDRGFISLMKTGRPSYWIPSPSTVSRDVKRVFARVRQRISNMLREHPGRINFATDAWTSPNHCAVIAITVHFEYGGVPLSLLLDVVEVTTSHTGEALARGF
ncbi:hypothetical protein BC835DRAFT_1242500, partial [Cytidiella melzeri]